jgi:wyosine [tRNA(Phe)-imidazoG37] synthetase (radical SAM superfamily)
VITRIALQVSQEDESISTGGDVPPIAFGPIPSRRLGKSLGINNIPPKVCTYSCLYCQVGPTMDRSTEPRAFYPPERIVEEIAAHVEAVRSQGEAIDHLTFAPDGEPTLDTGLGDSIQLLRPLGIPIAVISNGSLLWRPEVRERLETADWVSVKVDSAIESIWRKVDRPHPALDLDTVLDGIRDFAARFEGELVSETMLVDGLNDGPESVASVGEFLRELGLPLAYLSIPTRPTPYPAITAPDEATVTRAYALLCEYVSRVECLTGYEGDAFASTGDPAADLLAITAVHPMRSSAIQTLLDRTGTGWDLVEEYVADGTLTEVAYRGEHFYVRRWRT